MTAVFVKLLIYFWPFIREALFGGKFVHRLRRSRWLILSFMVNVAILILFMSTLETTVAINSELNEYRSKTVTLEAEVKYMREKPPEYIVPDYIKEQIATLNDQLKEYRNDLVALKAENTLLRTELTKKSGYNAVRELTKKDDVTKRLQTIQEE
jgi:cell division protein FtsB